MSGVSNIDEPEHARPLERKVSIQQLDLLVRRLDSLPTLPAVVAGVLNLTAEGADPKRLTAAVRSDPSVAACLLSLACGKRPNHPPRSVAEAVEVLTPAGVRTAVLGMKVLEGKSSPSPFSDGGFRTHCVAVAYAAEMLAERLGGKIEPSVAFVCGLLHDIGKLVMGECLPKSYRRVLATIVPGGGNIARLEREIIGTDHTIVGRRLARYWRLPACVQQAIWLHHQPLGAVSTTFEKSGLVAVVQLADTIARRGRLGFSGNYTFTQSSEALAAEIGLTAEDVSAVADALPARLEQEMDLAAPAEAATYRREGESPYRSALVEVGAELARLNEALSGRVEALGQHVEVLKRLRDFAVGVSPAAPMGRLCEEIARMFASVASIEPSRQAPVCAFAAYDEAHVTLAVCSGSAEAGETSFRLSSSRPVRSPAPAGACPAGQVVRSLLEEPNAWSDLIDIDSYTCVPLVAESRLVGGVLMGRNYAAGADDELLEILSQITAFILAAVGGRSQADRLAEQLAQASQRLDEAREALAQSRALSEVGEMAAGAAHEMNNPLAVISGRAQLLADRAKMKKDREAANLIALKAQEISDILTDLEAFARPSPPRPAPLALADLLASVKNKFESEQQQKKPAGPVVDIEIRPDCPPVWADAGQIEEVLLELLRNAATAAAGKVNVRIRADRSTSLVPSKVEGLTAGKSSRSPCVLIQVADDGPGMDEETLGSAFTPFFSYRPAGRGRGMGLTRARRSVETGGGRMWIESKPGEGTTVFIEVPAAQTKA